MARYVAPVEQHPTYLRNDQGLDLVIVDPARSCAAGVVSDVSGGWHGGTGKGIYVTFDEVIVVNGRRYWQMYVAEAEPLLEKGKQVAAGTPIMSRGSIEIGFWPSPLVGGYGQDSKPNQQSYDFAAFISSLGVHLPASALGPPSPSGGGGGGAVTQEFFDSMYTLWIGAGGPLFTANAAAAIACAECHGDTTAIDNTVYPNRPHYHPPARGASPEYSVGAWQINILQHPQYNETAMLQPLLNARAAVEISGHGSDFSPWSTFTGPPEPPAYLYFLNEFGHAPPPVPHGSPPGTAVKAPSMQHGWHHLTHQLARQMPADLAASDRYGRTLKRALAGKRR